MRLAEPNFDIETEELVLRVASARERLSDAKLQVDHFRRNKAEPYQIVCAERLVEIWTRQLVLTSEALNSRMHHEEPPAAA